ECQSRRTQCQHCAPNGADFSLSNFSVSFLRSALTAIGSGVSVEAITDPRFGENVARRGRVGLDLFAELADEDAQVLGLLNVIPAPDGGKQSAMRQHSPCVANEVSEQLEFLRCQMNLATFDGDGVRPQIEVEMAGFQYGRS